MCVGGWFVKGRTTHRQEESGLILVQRAGVTGQLETSPRGTQMGRELSRQWKQEPCSLEKLMQWLGRGSDVLWRWTHQVQWRILKCIKIKNDSRTTSLFSDQRHHDRQMS